MVSAGTGTAPLWVFKRKVARQASDGADRLRVVCRSATASRPRAGKQAPGPKPGSADDPAIDDVQAQQRSDDDPPRLARGRRVLLGDVLLAVRAALRILVDLPLAVRAGDRRVTVLTQRVINCFVSVPALAVILPFLVFRAATGHSNLPPIRRPSAIRCQTGSIGTAPSRAGHSGAADAGLAELLLAQVNDPHRGGDPPTHRLPAVADVANPAASVGHSTQDRHAELGSPLRYLAIAAQGHAPAIGHCHTRLEADGRERRHNDERRPHCSASI